MTVTTVGYGDVVPLSDAGKLILIPYSLIGIPLMYSFLSIAGSVLTNVNEIIIDFVEKKVTIIVITS